MRLWLSRRRLVRIHSKVQSAPTFQGILVERPSASNSRSYVLTRATMLEAEGITTELEGEQEIPASDVLFVQRMSGSGA